MLENNEDSLCGCLCKKMCKKPWNINVTLMTVGGGGGCCKERVGEEAGELRGRVKC